MYAWAFSMIFVLILGGYLFGLNRPNVNQASTISLSAGDAMLKCHEAAVAYAASNTTVTDAVITATATGFGCSSPSALGLSSEITPASALVASMTGRVVTTWLPAGSKLAGSSFQDVVRQVEQIRMDDPSVGLVETAGSSYCPGMAFNCLEPYVNTGGAPTGPTAAPINYTRSALNVLVPAGPAVGALVVQTVVTP